MCGQPIWCHNHSHKVTLEVTGLRNDLLVFQGSAVELIIRRRRSGWMVSWLVIHSRNEQAQGQVYFGDEDLLKAFGLSDSIPDYGRSLVERFGGTTANQGKFIRYKNWLNIPGPGTGNDGDPNLSLEVDLEMQEAVKKMVYGNH